MPPQRDNWKLFRLDPRVSYMDPKSMDNFQKSFNRKRPELGYGPVPTVEQKIAYLEQYAGQVAKRARKDEAPAPAPASASTPGDPTPLATPLVFTNTT